MAQSQEIGQAGPGFFSQINNMQEIPQVYDPEAIQREALQAPRIDPVMTIANAFGSPIGIDPGRVFSSILKDILFQHVFSGVVDAATKREYTKNTGDPFPSVPKGYQEGYYPPSKYAAPRSVVPSGATSPFIRPAKFDEEGLVRGETTDLNFPPQGQAKSFKEDLPDYAKIEAGDSMFAKPFFKGLSSYGEEGPPDPKTLLWHAIGLEPDAPLPSLARKIQKEGLSGGWFSERPGHNFGPIRLGAKPEDLPPMTPRTPGLREDPNIELIPRWDKRSKFEDFPMSQAEGGSIEPYTTASGHEVGISIHPSKFAVIDSEGNLLGKLAEQRAGQKATTGLTSQLFKQLLEEAE